VEKGGHLGHRPSTTSFNCKNNEFIRQIIPKSPNTVPKKFIRGRVVDDDKPRLMVKSVFMKNNLYSAAIFISKN
jgi:hypothetical protein